MYRYQTILIKLPDRSASCIVNLSGRLPAITAIPDSADSLRRLVSDLHHADIDTRRFQIIQTVFGKLINCLLFFINRHTCPCLRCLLLARISPEIRIVEIDQNPHAGIGRQFTHDLCFIQVIVTAAVAVLITVIRIIPYTNTNPVGAAVMQILEESRII